ncbi:hypothetical protein RRF57_013050 [Xylaria bambusicola]|uniref:Uncharacterized protein n=1 Tax=Xylaria bambusicola TaxID=326684 RepID=A0AAN7V0D3_9PEZI
MARTVSISAFLYGRIDTTYVPPINTPAGFSGMFVRYMGTLRSSTVCRGGKPARTRADSKL